MPLGPVEIEVIRNALTAAAAEMDVTVWRTSRSTIVRELLDYSTAVFDAEGSNLAQSARIPSHLNSMSHLLRELLDKAVSAEQRALFPDPDDSARLAEAAGADGITAHLREDRRHISDADIDTLMANLRLPLNLVALPRRPADQYRPKGPQRRRQRAAHHGHAKYHRPGRFRARLRHQEPRRAPHRGRGTPRRARTG